MKNYLITILLIVLLGGILDIILTEGRTKGQLRFAISVFSMLVILSPLKNFDFKNGFDFIFSETTENEELLANINNIKKQTIEKDINKMFEKNNIVGLAILIEIGNEDLFTVKKIKIDTKNLVLNDELENINIASTFKSLIVKNFNYKEEIISVDGT